MQNKIKLFIKQFWKSRFLQAMILIPIVYYIVFHYIPMYGVLIAFKNYRMGTAIMENEWVGFNNFIKFVENPYFFRLIKNTFLLSLYGLIWGFWPPILLALFLNEVKVKWFKKSVQTISYLPHFISTVSIIGMLYVVLSPQGGIINTILVKTLGIEPIHFVMETKWFRPIYIGSGVWQSIGWGSIIYLAALSSVNPELYQSATVDGANRFQNIWYISIPSIAPTITILLLLSIGTLFSSSTDKALLLQQPTTYEVSDIIGTYVYRRGIQKAEYSYSTAVGLFSSLINIILLVSANAISRRVSENSLW